MEPQFSTLATRELEFSEENAKRSLNLPPLALYPKPLISYHECMEPTKTETEAFVANEDQVFSVMPRNEHGPLKTTSISSSC